MTSLFKNIIFTLFIFSLTCLTSCTQLKSIDKSIKKVFSQVNRFERKKNNYANRMNFTKDKDGKIDSTNAIQPNPIIQKNIINEHGYLFEIINGVDPGRVISYQTPDTIEQVFLKNDQIYKGIDDQREVFGWHPYWMKSKWKNYPFELLSTVSFFSYKIDPMTGECQNLELLDEWVNSDFVATAKSNETRVLLTVSCHGENNVSSFLRNPLAWDRLYVNIAKLIIDQDADGVDINFENIPLSQRKAFVEFVKKFNSHLSAEFYKKNKDNHFISLTLPAGFYRESYDIKKLNSEVDLFTIMGYDYQTLDSPSPTAPLQSDSKGGFSLMNTIDYYTTIGIDKSKTILAFPHYGILWNIEQVLDENNKQDISASIERKLTYSEINKFFLDDPNNTYQIELDPISMTKVFTMVFDDYSIKEIFFDDPFTLSKKYAFAMTRGLSGVGIWALGYDDGRQDMWQVIDDSFSNSEKTFRDPIAEVNGFPIRFTKKLIQNKDVFIAIIVFLVMALITSFIILLSDWRFRMKLIESQVNTFFFIVLIFIFLIPLVVYVNEFVHTLGFYIKSNFQIYIGFFIGILCCLIGSKISIKQQEKP